MILANYLLKLFFEIYIYLSETRLQTMKLYTLSVDKYFTFIHIMDDIRDYQILRLELYKQYKF